MAVVVQCFHCNTVLELDDGFRGGVCRCSGCGSLLQVPKGEHEGQPVKKRKRPAGPPGPSVTADAASAAAGESGKADKASATEVGPSSSTLRRIQQARPMEQAVVSKQPMAVAVATNGTPVLPKEVLAAAAMVPIMPPRRSRLKLGLTIFLFVVLAAVVVVMSYFIFSYGG